MSRPTAKIAVCSLFRNSASTLEYFRAVISAQARPDIELAFSFVEGDSSDDTLARLKAWRDQDARVSLAKLDVEPVADFDDRVKKWALLGNVALETALATDCTHVLWCESDLALPHDLLEQLVASDVDIVAPAIFLGGMFYDTWGFRGLDGVRFTNVAPYHRDFRPHELVELASVGSVVLFKRAVFDRGVRFRGEYENGLLAGVNQDARRAGFQTFMDSRVAVLHPTSGWRKQQYKLERVEIVCASARVRETWLDVACEIENSFDATLGSLDVTGDHAVFEPARKIVERRLPGRAHTLTVRLASESRKRYALVLEDVGTNPA
ncbi:MAG: hypothetical protein SGI72_06110 [Planctomycetota bacterium]|nr:hypothetical protein [Planctomycetota bacterium]